MGAAGAAGAEAAGGAAGEGARGVAAASKGGAGTDSCLRTSIRLRRVAPRKDALRRQPEVVLGAQLARGVTSLPVPSPLRVLLRAQGAVDLGLVV
jgi:hypothetical protein